MLWARDLMDTPIVVEDRPRRHPAPRPRRLPGRPDRGAASPGGGCSSACSSPPSRVSGRRSRSRSCRSARRPDPSCSRRPGGRGSGSSDSMGPPCGREMEVDSIVTVFPEGAVGSADSQTVLIRVPPETLQLAREPGRPTASSRTRRSAPTPAAPSGCIGRRAEADLPVPPVHLRRPRRARRRLRAGRPAAAAAADQHRRRRDVHRRRRLSEPVGPSFWNITSGGGG